MDKRADLRSARDHILDLTKHYAEKMIPNVTLRSLFGNLVDPKSNYRRRFCAITYGSKDGDRAMVVYDSVMVRSNMYNIKSTAFNALVIHELCHVKHGISEHCTDSRRYHDRPAYFECVEEHGEKWMASPCLHPGKRSLRAYLGSDDMVVPDNILSIVRYRCNECDHEGLWDTVHDKHPILMCENCNSENFVQKKLTPFEVYKIAKICEIDIIDSSVGLCDDV